MNRCELPDAIDGFNGANWIELRAGTVKLTPVLGTPFIVTTTLPDVAPVGTGTKIAVGLNEVGVAATPLKVTVATVWSQPKFDPEIVMTLPGSPEVGDKLLMIGVDETTVNGTALLVAVVEELPRYTAALLR